MAPTPHELYERFVENHPDLPPGQYLHYEWKRSLEVLDRLGWPVAKLAYRQKVPPKGVKLLVEGTSTMIPITREERDTWIFKPSTFVNGAKRIPMTGNLLTYASAANVVILDWDDSILSREFQKLQAETLSMITARGYQFFCVDPGETITSEWVPQLRAAYRDYADEEDRAFLEVFIGPHYTVLPASVTCSKDHRKGNLAHPAPWNPCLDGQNHDFRVRLWQDTSRPLATFERTMEVLL